MISGIKAVEFKTSHDTWPLGLVTLTLEVDVSELVRGPDAGAVPSETGNEGSSK